MWSPPAFRQGAFSYHGVRDNRDKIVQSIFCGVQKEKTERQSEVGSPVTKRFTYTISQKGRLRKRINSAAL